MAPPTAFLMLEELATRWRRHPATTERLARQFNIPVYRLSRSVNLYALSDIERIEEQAKNKAPLATRSTWRKNRKEVAS